MSKVKLTLNCVALFLALFGMVLAIGCAGSAEKQEMSKILKDYSDAVNEYAAADDTHKAELKEKVESYKHKCATKMSELELKDSMTPQAMGELEKEFKAITKKYTSLSS